MDEITVSLRDVAAALRNNAVLARGVLLDDAADEIERLRTEIDSGNTEILRLRHLITEWANAYDDGVADEWHTAGDALRKAVGR